MVLRKHRNVFSDVSGVWSRPFDGYAALVRAQEWDVVDKLLFGSDFPLWTPDEGIAGLRELASLRSGTLPYVRSETVERIIEADSAVLLGLRA
jgi:predicted TIM-barrel fold metal-dependent hydrolase